MPTDASHPKRVFADLALDLVFSARGEAVVRIAPTDTSMTPHLRGGDAVLAVTMSAPPAAGDLLLFQQQDYWVVHRYLGRATTRDGRRGLRTRGDGRNVLDPLLSPDAIRGRVTAVCRGGSWRSLEGRAARAYARLVAGHALFWSAAGVAGRKVGLGAVVAWVDRGLLRLVVPRAFPAAHRRVTVPDRLVE